MTPLGNLYLHIGNGGVTFTVTEDEKHGPFVLVSASTFGHPVGSVGVYVTKEGLEQIAELFATAAGMASEDEYCCAARVPAPAGSCGSGTDSCDAPA